MKANQQQYEQLMLQYNQLKAGSEIIYKMIEDENFDSAITLIKSREALFLNCKNIRSFTTFSPEQEKEADIMLDEIRILEQRNIQFLAKNMEMLKSQLNQSNKTKKIIHAYDFDKNNVGNIINVEE